MSQQEFDNYIALLGRALKLSPAQRDAIADELRDHMEQRLAELTERGVDREHALTIALEEFGDANALAGEFTEINHDLHRRRIMRYTLTTVSAACIMILATFALLPERRDLPVAPQAAFATNNIVADVYLSADGIEQAIVDRLDITTFRSALGPRRSEGERAFAQLKMKPTRIGDGVIEFESDTWLTRIEVLEVRDFTGDGLNDVAFTWLDDAKEGSYLSNSTLIASAFSKGGPIVALGFTHADVHVDPKPAQVAAVDAQLTAIEKVIDADFNEIPFGKAIDFLRESTGANIFVNWKALEDYGVDQNTPASLRVKRLPTSTVLNLLLDSIGGNDVDWNAGVSDGGVFTISAATPEPQPASMTVRTADQFRADAQMVAIELNEVELDIKTQEIEVKRADMAKELAMSELSRVHRLAKSGAVTDTEARSAEHRLEESRFGVEAAQIELERVKLRRSRVHLRYEQLEREATETEKAAD